MDCLEARRDFGRFWRKTLEVNQRAAFLSHLRVCSRCDRSFRIFALTAPILIDDRHQVRSSRLGRTLEGRRVTSSVQRGDCYSKPKRRHAAGIMSAVAAAALLLYVFGPALRHHSRQKSPGEHQAQAAALMTDQRIIQRGAMERAGVSGVIERAGEVSAITVPPTRVLAEPHKVVAEASLRANPLQHDHPTLLDGDPLSGIMPSPRPVPALSTDR
jgi:hypothetical protein